MQKQKRKKHHEWFEFIIDLSISLLFARPPCVSENDYTVFKPKNEQTGHIDRAIIFYTASNGFARWRRKNQ
jgi:hypothetical protein